MQVKKGVTLEQLLKSNSKTAYYSSRTIWWTDDPNDLQGTRPGIPKDIFGAPLYEAPLQDFISQSIKKCEHFGKNEIETFVASHHKNLQQEYGDNIADFTNFATLDSEVSKAKKLDPTFSLLK